MRTVRGVRSMRSMREEDSGFILAQREQERRRSFLLVAAFQRGLGSDLGNGEPGRRHPAQRRNERSRQRYQAPPCHRPIFPTPRYSRNRSERADRAAATHDRGREETAALRSLFAAAALVEVSILPI